MPKLPKALSSGEEEFALHCGCYKLTPEREYVFHPTRKWAFDFAWPERMIAVEIEGGTAFGKSRHSRGSGFVGDCQKYNAAALLGWFVFRFTPEMVTTGEAIDMVLRKGNRTNLCSVCAEKPGAPLVRMKKPVEDSTICQRCLKNPKNPKSRRCCDGCLDYYRAYMRARKRFVRNYTNIPRGTK